MTSLFALSNVLLTQGMDAWAVYVLEAVSYPLLTEQRKASLLAQLRDLATGARGDLVIWRRSGTSDDPPQVFVAIRLPQGDSRPIVGALLGKVLRSPHAVPGRLVIARREVHRIADCERAVRSHVVESIGGRAATSAELVSLVGAGIIDADPEGTPAPIALIDGTLTVEPCVTRRLRACVDVSEHPRALELATAECTQWQAVLALGVLPDGMEFPGRAELLFAPLERQGLRVDAAIHAEWIGNARALRLAGRSMLDAEQAATEQLSTGRLPDTRLSTQVDTAIAYKQYLESAGAPPILRASITLRLTAPTEAALEEGIARLSAALAPVHVSRPAFAQLPLWEAFFEPGAALASLRAQPLTVEQLGGLMPIATEQAGTATGPVLGRVPMSGRSVRLDLQAASRSSRPPSILCVGTLGSGKTVTSELLALQALRAGSLVVDVDPKPDHKLDRLPELQGRTTLVDLADIDANAGLLDPLQIATAEMRDELAASFYSDLMAADPRTRAVIRTTIADLAPHELSSQAFIAKLASRPEQEAVDAAGQLASWAKSGLARLALAPRTSGHVGTGAATDLTSIRCRSLTLPGSGTARADYTDAERVSAAIMRLIAAYALRLTLGSPERHKVLLIDEAWLLLASSDGRSLIDRINRTGRSENATLILATQQLGDVEHVAPLIGTHLVFGLETGAEAAKAAELLGMDPSQGSLDELLTQRTGRCVMRDTRGRLARVQVTPEPGLLAALSTTPGEKP